MSRDKQIEEMAKVLNECCNRYDVQGNHLGNKCFDCECWCDTNHICCSFNTKEATALYNAGYRKASEVAELEERLADVTANWQKIHDAYTADCIEHYNKGRSEGAREIFEEMQKRFKELYEEGKMAPFQCLVKAFNETEKKYTEGER